LARSYKTFGSRFGEDKKTGGKYVPPGLREGGQKPGADPLNNQRSKDDANTIRVTNLPEEIQDSDIRELFQPFGKIWRIFLAKDKYTGQSKGFAFVSYEKKEDATKAIAHVNGFGYANLILNVEWAKPSANN
ncbi:eukaryotic translation initiation factor 3 subunit G-B-like, partial [Panonychus citri]|uniref:eukaryotic translation initiation factor 3 subunit G-B-like n=1 Tax=Panonychus citri TaxID=50023 RepID=UPI002306E763